jgi:C-terminal processing protease CtpA/Prc
MNDLKKAREKLHKRYELANKRQSKETKDEVYSRFLNAFATGLDPHSQYMPPEELEDFRIQTRLSLEGIGAVLRSEEGFTVVQSLVPGGAASREFLRVTYGQATVYGEGSLGKLRAATARAASCSPTSRSARKSPASLPSGCRSSWSSKAHGPTR